MLERNRLKWKRSFKETFFDIHQSIFYQHWACRHTLTFTDVFSDLASALNVRIRSSRSSSSSNNNWKINILDIVEAARWWCSCTGQIFHQQVRTANKKWPLAFIWYFTTTNIFILSNNIWTAKSVLQPVVGGMFPTFWSPPPCPDNQIDFFLLNYFFVFVFFLIST